MTADVRAVAVWSLVFLVLGWAQIDGGAYIHDEAWTLEPALGALDLPTWPAGPVPAHLLARELDGAAAHGPARVVGVLGERSFMHPPAYYLLLNGWIHGVGSGRVALRLFGLVVGLVTLLGLFVLSRRLAGPRAGPWVVALYAVSPWTLVITHVLRPYGLALAVGVWATVAVLDAAEPEPSARRTRGRVAFVLLSALGLYSIYHHLFVLAWHGLFLVVSALRGPADGRARSLVAAVALPALAGLLFVPWLPTMQGHLADTGSVELYFSGFYGAAQWPGQLKLLADKFLALVTPVMARDVVTLALTALELLTLPLVVWSFQAARRADLSPGALRLWATAPALPLLISAGDAWHDTHTLFITKTGFLMFPLLLLLIARGWQAIPGENLRKAGLAAWLALLGWASVSGLALAQDQPGFLARIASDLGHADESSHLVLVNSTHRGDLMPLVMSLRDAGVRDVVLSHVEDGQLEATVRSLLAEPQRRRITLVNVPLRCQCMEPTRPWREQTLDAVADAARARAWAVGRGAPGHGAQMAAYPRALTIVSPGVPAPRGDDEG